MNGTMLAFLFGVGVAAVWPDRTERAELARWVRDRVATISRVRNTGRHYDHTPHTLPRSAHRISTSPVCPFASRACKLHDFEGIAPRNGLARHTPEGLPNVWADLDTADNEQ